MLLFMGKIISVNANVAYQCSVQLEISYNLNCLFVWQGILADVSKLQLKEYKFEETENLRYDQ